MVAIFADTKFKLIFLNSFHIFNPCVITIFALKNLVPLEHGNIPDAIYGIYMMPVSVNVGDVFVPPLPKDFSERDIYGISFDKRQPHLSTYRVIIQPQLPADSFRKFTFMAAAAVKRR